jgi:hypothetical protein
MIFFFFFLYNKTMTTSFAAIATCKASQGFAPQQQSDRIFNPMIKVCPVWSGQDTAGRYVSANSFNNRSAGCTPPSLQMLNETRLRPQYSQYVNLDAAGISGEDPSANGGMFNNGMDHNLFQTQSRNRSREIGQRGRLTGDFGTVNGSVRSHCASDTMDYATPQDAQTQQRLRMDQYDRLARNVNMKQQRASGML